MTLLVTGGLGYIGSHACVALAAAGRRHLVIIDNLSNSKPTVLGRIRELAPGASIEFIHADVRDSAALETAFRKKPVKAVLHFAGLKAVGESVERPEEYRNNNVGGTKLLLDTMESHQVPLIVFSSSATVYGEPKWLPITETHPLRPQSPYGQNKLEIEELLAERTARSSISCFAALRYFNPIGAHPSGQLGEDPSGIPNNLFPYLSQVAAGRFAKLRVFGNDYPTIDGTGVRDYLHVMDLATAHISALRYLEKSKRSITVNVGTGRGHSVLEVVRTFETITGKRIPLEIAARRPGDIATCFADPSRAARDLGWRAQLTLEDMCRDAWRWQSMNPEGYP